MRRLLHLAAALLLSAAASASAGYSPSQLLLGFVREKVDAGAAKPWDLSLPADSRLIPQQGSKGEDRIVFLPGQPKKSPVRQYSGYVTVDEKSGRRFFYYFAEVRRNATNLPLIHNFDIYMLQAPVAHPSDQELSSNTDPSW